MKSPMIESASYLSEEHKTGYSELQVMHSDAGYYIGTVYTDHDGFKEPGSRDSDYFGIKEEAEKELKLLESGESTLMLRMTP